MGVERLAYRRLRNAPRAGAADHRDRDVASSSQNAVAVVLRLQLHEHRPSSCRAAPVFTIGNQAYGWDKLIVLGTTIPLLIALTFVVKRTRWGKAMRATAQDRDAARLMGIDVDRAISFAFGLGGALAGVGGFIYFTYFTQARFDLGFRLGLFAFTAAVLGGIGNIAGAALGGYSSASSRTSTAASPGTRPARAGPSRSSSSC